MAASVDLDRTGLKAHLIIRSCILFDRVCNRQRRVDGGLMHEEYERLIAKLKSIGKEYNWELL